MIRIEDLCLNLPGFALRNISLRIEEGEYFVLVGPYASGKTLLLETIAGLRGASTGRIWVNGREVGSLQAERRNIGVVYQDSVLFPHLSVRENIAFGPTVRHLPAAEIGRSVEWVAGLLDIMQLLDRRPRHLSGGERQKVALARALVTGPEVLLLDEPLAALDPQSRERVRMDLADLQKRLGVTVVHITHDFEEAVMMGTRIGIINNGSIEQVGSPNEIFGRPGSEFVARFTMARNILAGAVHPDRAGTSLLAVKGFDLTLTLATDMVAAGDYSAAIRPENILISSARPAETTANVFAATVSHILSKGSVVEVSAEIPPTLTCLLTRYACDQVGLSIGETVYLTIPPQSISLIPGSNQLLPTGQRAPAI